MDVCLFACFVCVHVAVADSGVVVGCWLFVTVVAMLFVVGRCRWCCPLLHGVVCCYLLLSVVICYLLFFFFEVM